MLATAKIVDGDTSSSFPAIELNRFSAVSLRPSLTSQNLSVFAVHKTITCKRKNIWHCHTKFLKLPNSTWSDVMISTNMTNYSSTYCSVSHVFEFEKCQKSHSGSIISFALIASTDLLKMWHIHLLPKSSKPCIGEHTHLTHLTVNVCILCKLKVACGSNPLYQTLAIVSLAESSTTKY